MIKGLSVALCGGLGSVTGVVIAAVILGINEAIDGIRSGAISGRCMVFLSEAQ